MSFKGWFYRLCIGGCFLFLAGIAVLPHVLPGITESWVDKKLNLVPGLPKIRIGIRSINLTGVDLRNIKVGDFAEIDSLFLDYSVASLKAKQIPSFQVSGLEINVVYKNGAIDLPGLDLSKIVNTGAAETTTLEEKTFPVVLPDRVEIKGARLNLILPETPLIIPFEISMEADQAEQTIKAVVTAFPFGQTVTAHLEADVNSGLKTISIESEAFELAHLQGLIALVSPGISIKGKTTFRLNKTIGEQWTFWANQVRISSPMEAILKEIICRFSPEPELISAGGSLSFGTDFLSPVGINYSFLMKNGTSWKAALESFQGADNAMVINRLAEKLHLKKPDIRISAEGEHLSGKLTAQMACASAEAELSGISSRISQGELKIGGTFDLRDSGKGVDLNARITSKAVELKSPDGKLMIPDLNVPGKIKLTKELVPVITLRPEFNNGEILLADMPVTIKGLEGSMPIIWPLSDKSQAGKIRAGSILWQGRNFAGISADIRQIGAGLDVSGTAVVTGLFKKTSGRQGLEIPFKSYARLTENDKLQAGGEFGFQPVQISSLDLVPMFLPEVKDLSFSGSLAAEGSIAFGNHHLTSRMTVRMADGQVSLKKGGMTATGIKTTLTLSDLLNPRSLPAQILTIDKLEMNTIQIAEARVKYTVESMESVLVEKSGFNWCGGRVTSESIRISPKTRDYELILYCDRLKLSEVLRQLGSFQAVGEGSLNGRIPIRYANGELSFENGFLFSTPGSGGTIRVTGTEILTAGIPENTPQFAQIDLAREALKQYRYEWAKLQFNTSGENLKVKMEFDGEPEKVLPFVYKKELGSFVRVDASSPGSRFQGIKIDVNLEVPFNRMMKFGTRLNDLLN